MANDDDEESVEVGLGSAKVVAKGKSVARLGDALADLLSPFSQGFGLVGDHIRIYRERSVRSVLERATEIKAERGEQVRPINPKNLLPLLENASLEDTDAQGLTDLWARLLVSGGEGFDSQLAIFSDSLKRLGRREAEVLRNLVLNYRTFPSARFDDIEDIYDDRRFSRIYRPLAAIVEEAEFDAQAKAICDQADITYGAPLYVGQTQEGTLVYFTELGTDMDSLFVLEREGLLRIRATKLVYETEGLTVTTCNATNLGVRLIARCYPAAESN